MSNLFVSIAGNVNYKLNNAFLHYIDKSIRVYKIIAVVLYNMFIFPSLTKNRAL